MRDLLGRLSNSPKSVANYATDYADRHWERLTRVADKKHRLWPVCSGVTGVTGISVAELVAAE